MHAVRRFALFVSFAWLLAMAALQAAQPTNSATSPASTPSPASRDEQINLLFTGPVPTFDIRIETAYANRLRREPRTDVPATLRVGTRTLARIGVHLKGAAGSFRDFDDRPALTLDFDEFVPGQEFSGLAKLHLNNSVQDPSRLSESIASRMYLESGVPTARAAHAFVRLNGRDLGLYVMKEGYDGRFLHRHFPTQGRPLGNLYDGGFLRDIDEDLERDTGKGPEDRSDLRRLQSAATVPIARRIATLGAALDVERFITLLAIQSLTDDWDGYARNRNNYRVYFDPATGRAIFIPHGMDQLFTHSGIPIMPDWGGLIARQVMEVPEWRSRYDKRLRELVERQFNTAWMTSHVGAVEARVLPSLTARRPEELQEWTAESRRQSNRISARIRSVRRQLGLPADPDLPGVVVTVSKPRILDGWTPRSQQGVARLERVATPKQALHLVALQRGTAASFRTSRSLPAGSYRFHALARTAGVVSSDEGPPGRGVGIRISGASRETALLGNQDWTPVQFDFELDDDGDVEFVIEIRADRGEAWFDLSSLRLSGR